MSFNASKVTAKEFLEEVQIEEDCYNRTKKVMDTTPDEINITLDMSIFKNVEGTIEIVGCS